MTIIGILLTTLLLAFVTVVWIGIACLLRVVYNNWSTMGIVRGK